MKIKFIKHWKRGVKIDDVRELADGVANLLIKRRVAVAFAPEVETAFISRAPETAAKRVTRPPARERKSEILR